MVRIVIIQDSGLCNFVVFEEFTRSSSQQIALEIILLPMLIIKMKNFARLIALMTEDHTLLPFSWLTLLLFLLFYLLLAFIVFAFLSVRFIGRKYNQDDLMTPPETMD